MVLDPSNGTVVGEYDASHLSSENSHGINNVLNGIAHSTGSEFWITGKNWSRMYLVQMTNLSQVGEDICVPSCETGQDSILSGIGLVILTVLIVGLLFIFFGRDDLPVGEDGVETGNRHDEQPNPTPQSQEDGGYSMIEEFEEDLDESTSLQLWLSDLSTDSATRNLGAVLIGIGGMLGFIIGIMLISGNVSDILSGQVEQSGGTADVEGIVISELVSNSSGAEGISGIDVLLYDQDGIVIGSDSTDSGGRFSIEDVPVGPLSWKLLIREISLFRSY